LRIRERDKENLVVRGGRLYTLPPGFLPTLFCIQRAWLGNVNHRLCDSWIVGPTTMATDSIGLWKGRDGSTRKQIILGGIATFQRKNWCWVERNGIFGCQKRHSRHPQLGIRGMSKGSEPGIREDALELNHRNSTRGGFLRVAPMNRWCETTQVRPM